MKVENSVGLILQILRAYWYYITGKILGVQLKYKYYWYMVWQFTPRRPVGWSVCDHVLYQVFSCGSTGRLAGPQCDRGDVASGLFFAEKIAVTSQGENVDPLVVPHPLKLQVSFGSSAKLFTIQRQAERPNLHHHVCHRP